MAMAKVSSDYFSYPSITTTTHYYYCTIIFGILTTCITIVITAFITRIIGGIIKH